MGRRPEASWVRGAERLRVAQQYADRPADGLVIEVAQRTTGAGRSILLPPAEVAALRTWLDIWLKGVTSDGG